MKKKLKLIFMLVLLFMVFIACCSPHIEPERMVVKEITVATDMDIMEIEKKCDIMIFQKPGTPENTAFPAFSVSNLLLV